MRGWVFSLGVALLMVCGAAEQVWKHRKHWIVWVALIGLLVLHLLIAATLFPKLASYEAEIHLRGSFQLLLAAFEVGALLTIFGYVLAPFERSRDLSRLRSD